MRVTSNADELGRTATALPSSPSAPAEPVGPKIGRYHLERVLGAGGMGVVHLAFDPDLERRVALKVLRAQTGVDAAKRLQREARAMARLSHPNVVTVHEVGTASGRDYVAMELIEGESLAEWLRSNEHAPHEIIQAFLAAGRGLAAAHHAGIVHRDFKPHNVLRSHDGRVCVTDFGLAREASAAADPLATTAGSGSSSSSQSALSGLTVSGSVLGTPAYMAPEQWSGGEVTPATDQFGYCVALWEALTGERPYRGRTAEELKQQVAAGPQALDASGVPRRVRAILRRGLDPDPSKRWRSMDELLQRLARAERKPWMVFAAIGAALIAAAVLALVLGGKQSASTCARPALDPAAVWSDGAVAAVVAAGQAPAAKLLAADHQQWTLLRGNACALDPAPRVAALACFDGVLARFDAVARAATQPGAAPLDVGGMLIDPAVCSRPSVPRLAVTSSPQFQEVVATRLRDEALDEAVDPKKVAALAERITGDPCAEALAQAYLSDVAKQAPVRERAQELAEQAAESCGDDRIRAELAVGAVGRTLRTEFVGVAFASRLARAQVAVQRVAQADLDAQLALFRLHLDSRSDRIDDAIKDGEAAAAGFAKRGRVSAQIAAAQTVIYVRQGRASAADLVAVASLVTRMRAIATAELGPTHPTMRTLAFLDAALLWSGGKVVEAHQRFDALRQAHPIVGAISLSGTVVDERGEPVAGAMVVAGKDLSGDGVSIVMPFVQEPGALRWATTKADGTFVIADAVPEGMVIAQLGDRRTPPVAVAPSVRLVIAPTSRLTGHVDLHDVPASKAVVAVVRHADPRELRYATVTPVLPDGSFSLDGAPRGEVDLEVVVQEISGSNLTVVRRVIDTPVVDGLALAVPTSRRTVSVLVRSTVGVAPGNAQVIIMPGEHPAKLTAQDLIDQFGSLGGFNSRLARPFDADVKAAGVDGKPGDLVVTGMGVPDGAASACAIGLPTDVADPGFMKAITQQQKRIEVRCASIAADAKVVVIEVPPWPRFD